MKTSSKKLCIHVVDTERDRFLLYQARELFFGKTDNQFVDWLYFENPDGEVVCAMAHDGETIAGQYMVIPVNISANDAVLKASLSLNTFTHPNYRKQGIFTKLARVLYATIGARGIILTVGLPNENSRPGFLKYLNFTESQHPVHLIRPLSWKPNGSVIKRLLAAFPSWPIGNSIRVARGLRIESANALDKDWVDELWTDCRNRGSIDIQKTGAWAIWRYMKHPWYSYRFIVAESRQGRPMGYAVWNTKTTKSTKFGLNGLTLMDIISTDLSTRIALIGAFIESIASEADAAITMANLERPECIALIASGFVPKEKLSFILRVHDTQSDKGHFSKFGTWSLSSSYSDIL